MNKKGIHKNKEELASERRQLTLDELSPTTVVFALSTFMTVVLSDLLVMSTVPLPDE